MRYDNCKDCRSKCEHAGKDREFVCINGISCKVTRKENWEAEAHAFIESIKSIAASEDSCERLEAYLSHHFDKWLEKFASTPEGIVSEMDSFVGDYLPF